MGGVNTIIENAVQRNSDVVVSKLNNFVPTVSVETSKFNKGFVDFCVIAGALASLQISAYGVKKLYQSLKPQPKALNRTEFLNRYGEGSWAVIAEVAHNEEYCKYLAKQGLGLILMGDEEDIRIVEEMLKVDGIDVRTLAIPVDWSAGNFDYESFVKKIKDYDLSFLVLPKMQQIKQESTSGSHLEQIPAYEHYYLLVRHLGPLLQWRSCHSAIILPSVKDVSTLKTGHGVRQGLISALDAFMRTLNYEIKNSIDVIAVRGSVENGFKYLGKQPVSN